MKRRKLFRHLQKHACYILRDEGPHTVFRNALNGLQGSVPRHSEVKPGTIRAICKDLGIPIPTER